MNTLTEDYMQSVLSQIDPDQPGGAGWRGHGYHGVVVILDVGHHGNLVLASRQVVGDTN